MINSARNFLQRADGHDRELLLRWALGRESRRVARRFWTVVTHIGGAPAAILLALAPFFIEELRPVGSIALATLALSHIVVQLIKRTVSRPRPSVAADGISLVVEPDRFSFPSGHSAAAMSVAFGFALAFPAFAIPLIGLGFLVGLSRVMLGVHYPGDVAMGQALALITGWLLLYLR